MQRVDQGRKIALRVIRVIYRELDRLDVDVITDNIRRENMALNVIDETSRCVQYLILSVLFVGKL